MGYFYYLEHGIGYFCSLTVFLPPLLSFRPPSVISSGARNLNCLHWISFLSEPVPRARFLPSVEMTKREGVEMTKNEGIAMTVYLLKSLPSQTDPTTYSGFANCHVAGR